MHGIGGIRKTPLSMMFILTVDVVRLIPTAGMKILFPNTILYLVRVIFMGKRIGSMKIFFQSTQHMVSNSTMLGSYLLMI